MPQRDPRPPRLSLARRLAFALVPALGLFGLAELGLRLCGAVPIEALAPAIQAVPFDEHAFAWPRDRALGPWFEVRDGRVHNNPVLLQRGMHKLDFDLVKSHDELRFFALGGSTTQGEPYTDRERGFSERLEGLMRTRQPAHAWRMVNAGVGGMDSNALPRLTREMLPFDPDGLLVYAGNNELKGQLLAHPSRRVRAELQAWGNAWATVRLGRLLWRRVDPPAPLVLGHAAQDQGDFMREVLEEQQGRRRAQGLGGPGERVRLTAPWAPTWPARTDPLYLETLVAFEHNLVQVLDQARAQGVEVFLAIPPINLRTEPLVSLVRSDLPMAGERALVARLQRARQLYDAGEGDAARDALDELLAIDPTHAEACWMRGELAYREGDYARARALLALAADRDFMGKITSHMQGITRSLCARPGVRCVDVAAAFEAQSPHGIPGFELFVDYCHPEFERGVQLVAEAYADAIEGWLQERAVPPGAPR
jgi:tetratricopeptide (TPR) repeat protein